MVSNIAGTDRLSVYLYRSAKVHLHTIREMMKVLTCEIHSTLTLMISDGLYYLHSYYILLQKGSDMNRDSSLRNAQYAHD